MGCDIHLFCEVRKDYDNWVCADRFGILDDQLNKINIQDIEGLIDMLGVSPLYSSRSYSFFTMLAGVRRQSDVEQIESPRGLPHDVSKVVKAFYERYKEDYHSCSWYTANELFRHKYELSKKDFDKMSDEVRYAYDELSYLCKMITERMCEVFYIFATSEARVQEKIKKYGDYFRVVFWFDS